MSKSGVPEGAGGTTSFTVEQDLQPTTLFYWRARAVQGTSTGPWSPTAPPQVEARGIQPAGELYDPLIHGETVGERIGSTDFIPGRGIRLNTNTSYVKYLAAADGPERRVLDGGRGPSGQRRRATRPRSSGCRKARTTTSPTAIASTSSIAAPTGFPAERDHVPRAVRRRPVSASTSPTPTYRFRSVFLLNPSTTYYWKFTWGRETGEVRTVLREGGVSGTTTLYNDVGGDAERPVHAKPALRVPGRPNGSQRLRVGVDSRHDLPECLAVEPAQAGLARQRAARTMRRR